MSPLENTDPVETGIQTLPDELLGLTFSMNGDMFSDNGALRDTRYTSQVCHRWRQILLERPSVWGKLIDLNVFCKATVKEEWGNEVLRRSQGALLWIRGSVIIGDLHWSQVFFQHLLHKHWTRIQKLVVDLPPVDQRYLTWQTFLQPAPSLETFQIRCYNYHHRKGLDFHRRWRASSEEGLLFFRLPQDRPLGLFSNDAPSLRNFEATHIHLPLSAPWLSNLRSVSFSSPITLRKAFQAIQQMPLLECLGMEELRHTPDEHILPHLTFTRLTTITLSDFLGVCPQILNHITPAAGCSLSFTALDSTADRLTNQILLDASDTLSKYLKSFYQTHSVTEVALHCGSKRFSFTGRSSRFREGTFFKVSFPLGRETFTSTIFDKDKLTAFNTLISVFTRASASFPFVRTLDLHLDVPTLCTSFLSASHFSYVEVFYTEESTLMTILKLKGQEHDSPSNAFPFPALRTLRLTEIQGPDTIKEARISPFILFLKTCRARGHPIGVLELYRTEENRELGYLLPFGRILDTEMVGLMLKVVSDGRKSREVVCSGANAQRLFITY
ncbi:hypothetical protein GALMADRAFT_237365 [Galerina marginata CBS 339.88]|uniref:F-box domain-containing protein n=1 Tax=Galerina marginata (strain CBS 339.88) TaxID=685588 RepID=A0A067TQB6_GALM3|nr:hypothetical protein GALMADRAFT_237365 [Galerina marginata CBS 339.88]